MVTFLWLIKRVYFFDSLVTTENSLKIVTRICRFSQYLETKLEMLFEIAKSVEIVIILRKTAVLP